MKSVTKEEWIQLLQEGDIAISGGRSLFARLQNLYRKRFNESDYKASHGFILKNPPQISEADGKFVTGKNKISRYFTNHHKIWVFRHKNLTKDQLEDMRAFISGSEQSGGIYSWGGIKEFALRFFTKKKMSDRRGVFCTEYTSRIINAAKIKNYSKREPWEIMPAYQLDWFMDTGCKEDWRWVAFYDEGIFYKP